jgi:hypothetical protein
LDKKSEAMIPQTLVAEDLNYPEVSGTFADFYTFTSMSYDAAWSMATPAVLLLVVAVVIAFFI